MLTQQHRFANQIMQPQRRRVYKQHMCGLCHALGDSYGLASRLLTGHEMILLNLLVTAQRQTETPQVLRRCPLNPLRFVTTNQDEGSDFAAAAAIELAQISLTDQIIDSAGRHLTARLGRWGLHRAQVKAVDLLRRFGFDLTDLTDLTRRQQAAETAAADDAARPTAAASAGLFAMTARLADNPANEAVLTKIGMHYGAYLYLADAYHDFPADMAEGHYNPLRRFCVRHHRIISLNQTGLRWLLGRFEAIRGEIEAGAAQLTLYHHADLVVNLLTAPVTYLIEDLQRQLQARRDRAYRLWDLGAILKGAFFLSPVSLLFYDCDCDCGNSNCDAPDCNCVDADCISNPCHDESNCIDFSCLRGPGECDNDCCNIACLDCSHGSSNACQHSTDACYCGDCGSPSATNQRRRGGSPTEMSGFDENSDPPSPA